MNNFLTVREVAGLTTLSVQQVYKLVQRKEIPHVRIGDRVFCDPDALRQWISEHTVSAAS